MSKFLNILCVLLIISILILPNFVQAINVDMNLTNTQSSNNISTNNIISNNNNSNTSRK